MLAADVRSRRDLLTAGLDRWHGDHLVRRGSWQRLIPSVYATRLREVTDRELITAARAHLGEAFVVTGAAACRALGLTDIPEVAGIDVLVQPSVRRVGGDVIRVWPTTRHLRTWRRSGAAYADAARAVIDCGRWLRLPQGPRARLGGGQPAPHAGAPEFDHTQGRHDAFLGAGLGLLHGTPRRARLLGPAYADVVVCAAQARQRLQAPEPAGLVVVPRGPLIGVDGRRPG